MENQPKLKQTDAIYEALVSELNNKPAPGQNLLAVITKDVKKRARLKLFKDFKLGKIKLSKVKSDKELSKYISNLISDRLRKDPRFKEEVKSL